MLAAALQAARLVAHLNNTKEESTTAAWKSCSMAGCQAAAQRHFQGMFMRGIDFCAVGQGAPPLAYFLNGVSVMPHPASMNFEPCVRFRLVFALTGCRQPSVFFVCYARFVLCLVSGRSVDVAIDQSQHADATAAAATEADAAATTAAAPAAATGTTQTKCRRNFIHREQQRDGLGRLDGDRACSSCREFCRGSDVLWALLRQSLVGRSDDKL